jgi:UDP-glucuronate 4-epimerase
MKVLITGTAGFIGYHLAKKLIANNHEVLGLDCINDYYDIGLKYDRLEEAGFDRSLIGYNERIISSKTSSHRFVKLELGDKEGINEVFNFFRPEIVVNLAAQAGVRYSLTNPFAYIESNITGYLNLLEASRRYPVNHFVYASSSSVYGLNKDMPFSEHRSVNHPVSLYAASKKSNELIAHAYSHLFNIPTTGLRFFTVYGPWGRPDMALFIFTKAILKSEPISVFNHGKMERDFTYIDDIVNGIEKIIKNPASPDPSWNPSKPDPASSSAPYRIYNIGNNSPVKLLDFIKAIEKETGKKAILNMEDIQAGDVESTWASIDDLMNDYSYKPSTPVSQGIHQFVKWFRHYYSY